MADDDWEQGSLWFDGRTYDPELDEERLSRQLRVVRTVMMDGREHTLGELAELSGGSEAGVSARIRDLRKPRFGGWVVKRRRIQDGLYGYRLVGRENGHG